jgi:fatty acid desaturase
MQATRAQDFMYLNGPLSMGLILLQWVAIAGLIGLSVWLAHPLVYVAVVWLIGSRMVALAEVIGHESVHNNLFARKALNRRLEFLWFLPIFETYDEYRDAHQKHHAHLLKEADPTYHDYKRWGMFESNINYFWVWFVRPFLFFDSWHLVQTIAHGLWTNLNYRRRILAFWIPAGIVIGLTGTAELLFWYWIVPLLWAYPALIFWSEVGEHYKTSNGATRNTFGLLEWLLISPHNDCYHAVHHRFPRIPWFNLGRAHKALFEPTAICESRGFLDLYRQIRAGEAPGPASR